MSDFRELYRRSGLYDLYKKLLDVHSQCFDVKKYSNRNNVNNLCSYEWTGMKQKYGRNLEALGKAVDERVIELKQEKAKRDDKSLKEKEERERIQMMKEKEEFGRKLLNKEEVEPKEIKKSIPPEELYRTLLEAHFKYFDKGVKHGSGNSIHRLCGHELIEIKKQNGSDGIELEIAVKERIEQMKREFERRKIEGKQRMERYFNSGSSSHVQQLTRTSPIESDSINRQQHMHVMRPEATVATSAITVQEQENVAIYNCQQFEDLYRMLSKFRVNDLQYFLQSVGVNKLGRKQDLLARSLDLVRSKPFNMNYANQIREIDRRRTGGSSMPYVSQSNHSLAPPSVPHNMTTTSVSRVPTSVTNSRNFLQGIGSFSASMRSQPNNTLPYAFQQQRNNIPQPSQQMPEPVKGRPDQLQIVLLPFYDSLHTLLAPTELTARSAQKFQENYLTFKIPSKFLSSLNYNSDKEPLPRVELQLRFFLLDTSCEQKDEFPPQVVVRIDDQMVQLPNVIPTNKPGVEPKRPSRPVCVGQYCQPPRDGRPYRLSITWQADKRSWVVALYAVRRLTSEILLRRLKSEGSRSAEFTRKMIKQRLNLDTDDDIATDSFRVSLICPLGKTRMNIPCKPRDCQHLQCFDVNLFLMMNEKRPTWVCPVCDKPASFKSLVIDGFFEEVLKQIDDESREIELFKNGTWRPIKEDEEENRTPTPPGSRKIKQEALTNENVNVPSVQAMTQPASVTNDEPECIDLTDDGDGDSPCTSEATGRASKRPLTNSSAGACSSRVASSTSPPESDYNSSSASPSLIVLDSPPSRPGTEPNDPGPSVSSLPTSEPPKKRFAPELRPPSASTSGSLNVSSSSSINNQQYLPPPPLPHIMNDPRADLSMVNSVPSSVSNNVDNTNWLQQSFNELTNPQAAWAAAINQFSYPSAQYLDYPPSDYPANPPVPMLPSYVEEHVTANLQEFYARCGFTQNTNFNNNT